MREYHQLFMDYYGVTLTERGIEKLDSYASRFGEEETYDAVYIAGEKYNDPVTAMCKIGGILYNRWRKRREYFKEAE